MKPLIISPNLSMQWKGCTQSILFPAFLHGRLKDAVINTTTKPWRRAEDPEWDWKSTTSSDEAIGHIFAFGAIAELVDNPELREKAIMLIDTLMSHVVKNNFYLIDWNGEPTLWGKWNPDYVNARPEMVGDRKLNSSNIICDAPDSISFYRKGEIQGYRILSYERTWLS